MDVEVEHPHVHHHATGSRRLDLVLPIVALFVSLVSIGIAYHHGHIMQELVHQNERLVQANSLPHLALGTTISNSPGGTDEVRYSIANKGVGPADIRSVVITIDGRPVSDHFALLRECCGLVGFSQNATLQNTMMSPQESLDFLVVNSRVGSREGLSRLARMSSEGRIDITVCYCSVFEECWLVARSGSGRPRQAKNCPASTAPRV